MEWSGVEWSGVEWSGVERQPYTCDSTHLHLAEGGAREERHVDCGAPGGSEDGHAGDDAQRALSAWQGGERGGQRRRRREERGRVRGGALQELCDRQEDTDHGLTSHCSNEYVPIATIQVLVAPKNPIAAIHPQPLPNGLVFQWLVVAPMKSCLRSNPVLSFLNGRQRSRMVPSGSTASNPDHRNRMEERKERSMRKTAVKPAALQ